MPAEAAVVETPVAPARRPKKARKPAKPLDSTAVVAAGVLITVAVLAVWSVLFAVYFSRIQEHRNQRILYSQFRSSLAAETAPLGGVIAAGTPVALISIPGASLPNAVVVEGTSAKDLAQGVGHVSSSVLPGQSGVSVLFGRSFLFGGPFSRLSTIRPGQTITCVTQQGTSKYVVDRVRRPGDAVVPLSAGASRLVLVTSEGSGWRSGWAPSHVVYVDASLVGKATVPLGGQPSAVPSDEKAMASDSAELVLVVIGLQGLLVTAVGAVVAAARWSKIQTYAVALPVVIALLWYVSDSASYLLPNLL